MKNALTVFNYIAGIVLLMFLTLPIFSFAQTTNPTPVPTPVPTPYRPPVPTNREFNSMANLKESQALREELRIREQKLIIARRTVNELYRKPTNDELLSVKVDQDLITKYSSFLKQDNTGLIKLLNNSNCSQNSKIVVATNDCLGYKMPGAGASFSFRTNNYRITHMADLNFTGNYFVSSGVWAHGILVNIGNFPLETFSIQNKELDYIESINPGLKYENVKDFYSTLAKGISSGKFMYRNSAPVQENSTYLLRSIAYRGTINKSVEGFVYNELDYDKRKDIVVVFRIVRKQSDGSITILWKKLSSKESPKIMNKDVKIDSTARKNDFIAK
jgi:hypothetical protein